MAISFAHIEVKVDDFGPGLRALEVACGLRSATGGGHDGGGAAEGSFTFLGSVTLRDRPGVLDATERARRDEFETQQGLRRSFARFVELLERFGRRGLPTPTVAFSSLRFDEPDLLGFDEADLTRLFEEVLPSLPILERVRFFDCSLPIEHLTTFLSKVSSTSNLWALEIDECRGDFKRCVPALASMIRRNVPIHIMELNATKGLDRDACRQVFESLQHNSHLWSLEVRVEGAVDDALILPTKNDSALRRLTIDVRTWTREGKAALARQLKTNTLLEDLQVIHRSPFRLTHRPWVEMLKAHNFALRSLREEQARGPIGARRADHMGDLIPRYLSRNGRIHQALDDLRGYHVSPTVLWPNIWEMVSGIPTLLYRFVRLGNINALVDLVVANNSSNKRSRPPPTTRRSRRVARLRM